MKRQILVLTHESLVSLLINVNEKLKDPRYGVLGTVAAVTFPDSSTLWHFSMTFTEDGDVDAT